MRQILVTRALADAIKTGERLQALGCRPLIAPLTRIISTGIPAPATDHDALIVTSAHALEALRLLPERRIPVFAVGERTAAAVREAGFSMVQVAEGDAVSLADLIRRTLTPPGRLLHVTARHHKVEPAASLREAGLAVVWWEAYEAEAIDRLPEPAALALRGGRIAATLQYSNRSATIFIQRVKEAGLLPSLTDIPHLCLSEDVAGPFRALGLSVEVAATPHETALLSLIGGAPTA